METKHRTEAARRQNDHFLKPFHRKSDLASQPAPKKTPTASTTRTAKKNAILQPRTLPNRPQRKRDFAAKTLSAENRDRLNPEGLQSDRTGANPCPLLMANEF